MVGSFGRWSRIFEVYFSRRVGGRSGSEVYLIGGRGGIEWESKYLAYFGM